MPIHDFGFKDIDDAEKEVKDGKAQEIKKSVQEFKPKPKPEPDFDDMPEIPPKATKKVKLKINKPKVEKKPSSHPMVNGLLEIEEEEL